MWLHLEQEGSCIEWHLHGTGIKYSVLCFDVSGSIYYSTSCKNWRIELFILPQIHMPLRTLCCNKYSINCWRSIHSMITSRLTRKHNRQYDSIIFSRATRARHKNRTRRELIRGRPRGLHVAVASNNHLRNAREEGASHLQCNCSVNIYLPSDQADTTQQHACSRSPPLTWHSCTEVVPVERGCREDCMVAPSVCGRTEVAPNEAYYSPEFGIALPVQLAHWAARHQVIWTCIEIRKSLKSCELCTGLT